MRSWLCGGLFVVAAALTGCAHNQKPAPQAEPKPTARGIEDPVQRLIAEADKHLDAGLAELKEGHLNSAREEFDRSIDVYLTAPGGAFANPKLAEAYKRTVEAIYAREIEALSAGDGFREKPAEPASIDAVADIAVTESVPSDDTRRVTEEASREEEYDIPLELNESVLSCVELYRGRLHDWYAGALQRGGRYLPKIREIFAEEGVPQDLAYVAMVESAFRTAALSRAKARGVWQFIPATGRRYGLAQDWWVDERSDPVKATRAAAQYLKVLYEMFGDWNLALAGYNAGELVVVRAINRYHTKDFWQLSKTRGFRRETKNYVPLIHAAIVVAKAPGKYGFDVTPEPELAFDTVPIEGAIDLRVVSECAGATLADVQELNPALRRLATPAGKTFPLKVPPGTGETLKTCLEELPSEKRVHFRTHTVARGQTLSTIAAQYGARTRDIADANGLSVTRRVPTGTELIIPVDATRAATPPVRRASVEPELAADKSSPTRITYRIKPGDTLVGIASQYGTTVQNLQSWNGLRNTRIAAGSTLTIYTPRKF